MTADEIRTLKNKLNPDHESGCFWFGEIALQLALGNERLERIATELVTLNRLKGDGRRLQVG